jgi:tetratricopeptide (TPR) repeat protein
MIERLLAGQDALERGELELADRLFRQVADADPRNAIALVGLARIAARRDRDDEARSLLERALAIDPDEAAAKRLLVELDSRPDETPASAPPPAAPAPAEARPSLLARLRRWLGLSRGPG